MGSGKFGFFLLFTAATSKLTQLALLSMFRGSLSYLVGGPYDFIFAMFVHFYSTLSIVSVTRLSVC